MIPARAASASQWRDDVRVVQLELAAGLRACWFSSPPARQAGTPAAASENRRRGGRPSIFSRFAWVFVIAVAFTCITPESSAQTPSPSIITPSAPAAPDPAPAAPVDPAAQGATTANADPFRLNIGLEGTGQPGQISVAVQIVLVMTLLSVAPSIVLLMTTFTRIVIVLGFVRTALGTPSAPSNQIVVGLSLFLTFFLMGPVFDRVHKEALGPYLDGQITVNQALDQATGPLKEFMLKQTRTRDLEYFLELGGFGPTAVKDLPMRVVIPAFVISELQTAFQMGFLLFLPFLVIDFLVSSV